MELEEETEKKLAVTANWGLLGSFAVTFILSGFGNGEVVYAIIGFGLLILAFVAHIIINRIYGVGFNNGEIAIGFIVFGVALLGFVANRFLGAGYSAGETIAGVLGFGALAAAFIAYVITKYGLKGAFSMFHQPRI